jgi:hypothetical protein
MKNRTNSGFAPHRTHGRHRHYCDPGGILLPALSKPKERGKRIVCLNNLKQLVLRTLMYADDHSDRLPYGETFFPHWYRREFRNGYRRDYGLQRTSFYYPSNPKWNRDDFGDWPDGRIIVQLEGAIGHALSVLVIAEVDGVSSCYRRGSLRLACRHARRADTPPLTVGPGPAQSGTRFHATRRPGWRERRDTLIGSSRRKRPRLPQRRDTRGPGPREDPGGREQCRRAA